jgi:Nucleotide modification associated domain 2
MRLFSYTIPIDDGAAPNPFNGMCSLAICKPGIRRVAKIDDWVAGLGSKNAPSGDLSGRLVYAMKITEVLSLADYDRQAPDRWPHRIPNVISRDLSERLGDCIYDFSSGTQPRQRAGVHGQQNITADLSGLNVLLSTDFYYFGSRAIPLPQHLLGICHQTQGHRSDSNAEYVAPFLYWLRSLKLGPGQLYGWPDTIVDWNAVLQHGCGCPQRAADGADNPEC